jgi:DNA-binding YbaB/EbfC family protein
MKGFGGGMQQLMKQANQMQNKMKKVQEELALKEFNGTSGGGAVNVVDNGNNEIKSVVINPEAVTPDDVEMLQDLIMSATNDALKNAKSTHDEEMAKVTGGMNIPGMF